MNKILYPIILTGCILLLLTKLAQADSVFLNTMSMLDIVLSLIFAICKIAGVIFMFMALVCYRRYRRNSAETPLSKVFWTGLLGVAIFVFPLIAQQTEIYQVMTRASDVAGAPPQIQTQSPPNNVTG